MLFKFKFPSLVLLIVLQLGCFNNIKFVESFRCLGENVQYPELVNQIEQACEDEIMTKTTDEEGNEIGGGVWSATCWEACKWTKLGVVIPRDVNANANDSMAMATPQFNFVMMFHIINKTLPLHARQGACADVKECFNSADNTELSFEDDCQSHASYQLCIKLAIYMNCKIDGEVIPTEPPILITTTPIARTTPTTTTTTTTTPIARTTPTTTTTTTTTPADTSDSDSDSTTTEETSDSDSDSDSTTPEDSDSDTDSNATEETDSDSTTDESSTDFDSDSDSDSTTPEENATDSDTDESSTTEEMSDDSDSDSTTPTTADEDEE